MTAAKTDWRCAGCGAHAPKRIRSCDCPTNVVVRGTKQAWKVGTAIITSHEFPPIPDRRFDWVAYRKGDEEAGTRGWGRTEQEAILDLREREDESA